jgi:hypothetical protein
LCYSYDDRAVDNVPLIVRGGTLATAVLFMAQSKDYYRYIGVEILIRLCATGECIYRFVALVSVRCCCVWFCSFLRWTLFINHAVSSTAPTLVLHRYFALCFCYASLLSIRQSDVAYGDVCTRRFGAPAARVFGCARARDPTCGRRRRRIAFPRLTTRISPHCIVVGAQRSQCASIDIALLSK